MARTVGLKSRSPQRSNSTMSGLTGGTLGGIAAAGGRPGARNLQLGDEVYLWILVALELGAMGWLRHYFRKRHGG